MKLYALIPIVFVVFHFSLINTTHAADPMTLSDAVSAKRISLEIVGNGGLGTNNVNLLLRNNVSSSLDILVPAGQLLHSVDSDVQDLIVLDELIVSIPAKGKYDLNLPGACTQRSNNSPKKGEIYKLGAVAEGSLLEVARITAKNDFHNTSAQAAVWGITNNGSVDNVHGQDDVNITWDLVKIVALYQRKNVPDKEEFLSRPTPPARILFSVRTDMAFHAPREMKASLVLYNENDEKIRTYFDNKNLHRGLHIFTVGVNDILEEVEIFKAKLVDPSGEVIQEINLDQSVAYEEIEQEVINIDFEYIVREASNVSMLIYDSKDQLVEEVFANRKMSLSKRKAKFKFFHALKDEPYIQVKVLNGDGEVLHLEKISNN